MKKSIYSLLILIFFSQIAFAQREGSFDKEKLKDARIAFITDRLDLSSQQAERFWPIFNKYSESREANLRKMASLNPRREEGEISDSQAKTMITERFKLQRQMVADEEKFVQEVSSVISYSQILQLNGIARDFTRMIYQRHRRRDDQKP
ncbi:hypothetical protein [Algoriphagus zhangzhouensis]|uniref:LTXXQ motif family protein n=1 Tax=Algoriphagus zhangzhouensis TaxID=1073327 RepID=A0A1M7Z497_9BACT|nr:hypothetical protein [Algoriphagus zhangzhouensis]TDY48619.1 hypothetical protein A8938_0304 [Algoriphagus zhangzhouensis]SHO59695.1 hypothetical protein SAMN04488108_0304 [Algoriphagus zhangzhouensis]